MMALFLAPSLLLPPTPLPKLTFKPQLRHHHQLFFSTAPYHLLLKPISTTTTISSLPLFATKTNSDSKSVLPGNTDYEDSEINIDDDDPFAHKPWEGAIMFRRDPTRSHAEFCTTLERLGLEDLSSDDSVERAAAMGIRLPPLVRTNAKKPEKEEQEDDEEEEDEEEEPTPVLVSVDVTRRRRRLRLDGIVKTVITLPCYR